MPDMHFPSLNGNWVDFVILILCLYHIPVGFHRGLLLGIVDVAGFVLSFLSSLRFYSIVGWILAANFGFSRGIANTTGFLLAGILTQTIFSFLINIIAGTVYPWVFSKIPTQKMRTRFMNFDRILGIVPSVSESLIISSFLLTIFIALPVSGAFKKDIFSSKIGSILVSQTQGVERQLNSIFGEAITETLTFLTVNPKPDSLEKVDLGFTQKTISIDENAEQSMLTLVNQERIKVGLSKLGMSSSLRDLSRVYASDMFARGYFSHYNPEGQSPFDRMKNHGISFFAAGENLALAPNVTLAHQGLMNSPGHRANILSSDFGKVGIGAIDGGIYGMMFVQEFTD